MAGRHWFRLDRNARAWPVSAAGWAVTIGLLVVEFVGTACLILLPRALGEEIGWGRGLGWLVLSGGNIVFFILLAGAHMAEGEQEERS